MPASRALKASSSPLQRSRVGNGRSLFLDGDGRSAPARRYREIFCQIITDIGGDPSEAQTQLARRATMIALECEQMESRAIQGERINLEQFATVSNALRRLFETLGIKRVPKDISTSLQQHIQQRYGSKQGRNGATPVRP